MCFYFVGENLNKKLSEGKFQNKIPIRINGTESTVKTDTGKINQPKIYFGTFSSDRKQSQKRSGHQLKRRDKLEKQILLAGSGWQTGQMGRNTP